MRYWWVNHKQTSRQEIAGSYLWSPRYEANGARSQFYDNMRLATPGDRVLSYSGSLIAYIGTVLRYAVPAFKPLEFGAAGHYWSDDGWLLPVEWRKLLQPVYPRPRINELGKFLPIKYSPIHPETGKGNQKAYLAEVNEPVFQLLLGADWEQATVLPSSPTADTTLEEIDDQVEGWITQDPDLSSTTKQQLVLARRGQGIFRGRVSEMEQACRLTDVCNQDLLIASHIKPWRVCSTAAERLDGANGLMLTPDVDRLFDRGLIGFEPSGDVVVSSRLEESDLQRLGLRQAIERKSMRFTTKQTEYLAYHRKYVFHT